MPTIRWVVRSLEDPAPFASTGTDYPLPDPPLVPFQRLVKHHRRFVAQWLEVCDTTPRDTAPKLLPRGTEQLQFGASARLHSCLRLKQNAACTYIDEHDFLAGPQ